MAALVAASGGTRAAGRTKAVAFEADPCAEIRASLGAAEAARVAAEREAADLREQVAQLRAELQRVLFPEDTPYGAFLASYEGQQIVDPDLRADIKAWLRELPVFLRPGEATWIAERERLGDWRTYARSAERALIYFLGPDRLAAELPEARLEELRAYYADERIFD